MLGINLYWEILFYLNFDDVYKTKLFLTNKQFKQILLHEPYILQNCIKDSLEFLNVENFANSFDECLSFIAKIKQQITF